MDILDINVEVLNGIEKYSQIRRKQETFQDMQEIPGTWSVGEMATLLGETREAIDWLPFEGRVWTAPETGEIRRISWLSSDRPTESGVAQVLWTVDFGPVELSSLVVTLPQRALYRVRYRDRADRVDWNTTNFSEYRRYGSDNAIYFNE